MIDASQGFMKDGPKNRLRERDVHRIVDAFQRRQDVPRYARQVSLQEIEKSEHNLNLPRYIDSQLPEDRQDIEGHLLGGIPEADVTAPDSLVSRYWAVCSQLERALFKPNRPGYLDLAVDKATIKSTIHSHAEFVGFIEKMNAHFAKWRKIQAKALRALRPGCHPKEVIAELSESLLAHYQGQPLIDVYAVYQHLLDYWAQTMQDDCYVIAADGWSARTYRVIETDKKGKQKDKGWACDLVPKALIVARYFAKEQVALAALRAELEGMSAKLAELEDEHSGDDAAFAGFDKINVAAVKDRLHEIEGEVKAEIKAAKRGKRGVTADNEPEDALSDELRVLLEWLKLAAEESALKKRVKEADAALDAAAYAKYLKLPEVEVQALVVDDKWLTTLDAAVHGEMDRLSQQLTAQVNRHLEKMGFAWR